MTEMIKAYNIIVNEPVFNAHHISADEASEVTKTLREIVMLGYSSADQIAAQFFGAHTARWVGEARALITKLEGPKGPSAETSGTEDKMTRTEETNQMAKNHFATVAREAKYPVGTKMNVVAAPGVVAEIVAADGLKRTVRTNGVDRPASVGDIEVYIEHGKLAIA